MPGTACDVTVNLLSIWSNGGGLSSAFGDLQCFYRIYVVNGSLVHIQQFMFCVATCIMQCAFWNGHMGFLYFHWLGTYDCGRGNPYECKSDTRVHRHENSSM